VQPCESSRATSPSPGASALLSSRQIKNAQLKIYKGGPHGMCSTLKDEVNADLLAFLKA